MLGFCSQALTKVLVSEAVDPCKRVKLARTILSSLIAERSCIRRTLDPTPRRGQVDLDGLLWTLCVRNQLPNYVAHVICPKVFPIVAQGKG